MKTITFAPYGNVAGAGLALASALLVSTANAAPDSKLNVGDSAPVLHSIKWLKGTSIPKFERGHVYVVELWATWCGPYKANISRLTELAEKYKGKVDVIGAYQMICSVRASETNLSPEIYNFGLGIVDEALLKKDRIYFPPLSIFWRFSKSCFNRASVRVLSLEQPL